MFESIKDFFKSAKARVQEVEETLSTYIYNAETRLQAMVKAALAVIARLEMRVSALQNRVNELEQKLKDVIDGGPKA